MTRGWNARKGKRTAEATADISKLRDGTGAGRCAVERGKHRVLRMREETATSVLARDWLQEEILSRKSDFYVLPKNVSTKKKLFTPSRVEHPRQRLPRPFRVQIGRQPVVRPARGLRELFR